MAADKKRKGSAAEGQASDTNAVKVEQSAAPEAAAIPTTTAPTSSKAKAAADKKRKGSTVDGQTSDTKAVKVEQPAAALATAVASVGATLDTVYSWCVEYAKSNRSTCQATNVKIEEGSVRIGKEVDNTFKPGAKMFLWYKPVSLFELFRKGAESKPRIKAVTELVGFDPLKPADQAELSSLVEAEVAFRAGLQEAEGHAQRFVHPDGKFWSIVANDNTTRVKWGKVGEEAVLSEKTHADDAAAQKFVEKMVRTSTYFSRYDVFSLK